MPEPVTGYRRRLRLAVYAARRAKSGDGATLPAEQAVLQMRR